MIRSIHLHGSLADKFGKEPIELDVDTPTMVIRGVSSALPGFEAEFRKSDRFNLIAVDEDNTPLAITEQTWAMTLGKNTHIHVVPIVEGAGTVDLAWAFAAYFGEYATAAYYVAYAAITIASMYAMSAISQALAPSPDMTNNQKGSVDQRPSFIFNGPVNITAPGYPVPLVYGQFRPGSVVISVGVSSEEMTA